MTNKQEVVVSIMFVYMLVCMIKFRQNLSHPKCIIFVFYRNGLFPAKFASLYIFPSSHSGKQEMHEMLFFS